MKKTAKKKPALTDDMLREAVESFPEPLKPEKPRQRKRQSRSIPIVAAPPEPLTQCPKCKSVRRTSYHNIVTRNIGGKIIQWKRTACQDCGQQRIDRHMADAV